MGNPRKMRFETKVLHAGIEPDKTTGAIMTPIFQTSTYVQTAPGNNKGFEYSRTGNPTRKVLENNLAALENGAFGLAFGSGMAAIDAVMKLLKPGDEVLSTNDLYGGSYRLFTKIYSGFGLSFRFADLSDLSSLDSLITPKTKLVWVESPTNPMLGIVDIAALAARLRGKNILLGVDNTFASPFLQTPLDLGADIVMHSITKYIGGHSDVVMGALVCKDDKLAERLYFIQNSSGAVPGPMDSFLVLRGIKTLHLRMQRHCENGKAVAEFLSRHTRVDKVYWPGLSSHPNHIIAAKQMRGFGGLIAFELGSFERARTLLNGVRLMALAESLGGVETLISHPASMTHASVPQERRLQIGLTDDMVRISVGIEDVDDLKEDLEQALARV